MTLDTGQLSIDGFNADQLMSFESADQLSNGSESAWPIK